MTWTFSGVVTGEELLGSNQEIYGDERFDEMTYQIVDLTRVERFDVTQDDMEVMASNDKAAALSNPFVKVAIAARDETIKQLSSYYEAHSSESPWKQQIFDTLSDAQAWAILKEKS
ncbi:MAG TPA: hypothetical protein VHL58_06780 [Thermoanaerobaculia bacterium]|nr:hypothetical protein [Thermoanaerobaculia bacterium]